MEHPFLLTLYREISRDKQWINPGTDAYFRLLQLLQSGEAPLHTFDDMVFLLETLWLKSEQHRDRFRALLEQRRNAIQDFINWQSEQAEMQDQQSLQPTGILRDDVPPSSDATPTRQQQQTREEQKKEPLQQEETAAPAVAASITFTLSDDKPAHSGIFSLQADGTVKPRQQQSFLFTNDYFPVKNRQLQQAWRSLKSYSGKGLQTDHIDFPKTIEMTARKGFFSALSFERAADSRLQVLLLLDRGQSMLAMEAFGKELWQTMPQQEQWPEPLYFRDLPRYDAYNKDYFLMAGDEGKKIALRKLFSGLHRKDIAVLIYSDAGALLQDDDAERLEHTRAFLAQLYGFCARISWINPAPRERWDDTNAGILSQELPMFDTGRNAVEQAIAVLKGKFSTKPN